ncbi:hypothetical protein BJ878DRAFT_220835 [Calycina marina]|uniref:PQ-loop repeat-containing protein 1 n=1 Tax=Calycina marina TaxID=1763456 RepID=A0A9P7YYH0_9HELO|nr:hypothetical protein BJ878DRAFT_220835 [Calycina marina]
MWLLSLLSGFIAPAFIILSPVISYSDQIKDMYRRKSSDGFSLDIPLIMLVASMLRIFYYPGAKFDESLLIQSFIMIAIQVLLLKIGLEYRPSPSSKGGEGATPFSAGNSGMHRPFNFWKWKSHKKYWQFLLYLFITLTAFEIVLSPMSGLYSFYSAAIGYIGLSIEAILPVPQLISNFQTKSTKGFRLSIIVSWIGGDIMKMFWFFTATSEIPWAFKLCGIFQMCCDLGLGAQYLWYRNRHANAGIGLKDHMSPAVDMLSAYRSNGYA